MPEDSRESARHGCSNASTILCQSCARPDQDMREVQRLYVVPATPEFEGAGAGTEIVDEDIELWCFSCRSIYPHRSL